MKHPNRYYISKENGAAYEPSPPVTECSGCMQDCIGIWGSLYTPVNAPAGEKILLGQMSQNILPPSTTNKISVTRNERICSQFRVNNVGRCVK